MKKEIRHFSSKQAAASGTIAGGEETECLKALLNEHIRFIEIQCRKITRQNYSTISSHPGDDITIENEILELNNNVLDKLGENDFKVLKQFKGNARLSTYLTAVIANQAVDMIRRKKGRKREKERAGKFGDLGEKIYKLVFEEGLNTSAAYTALKSTFSISGALEEVEAIVEKIRGKGKPAVGNTPAQNGLAVKDGFQDSETGEFIIADTGKTPEDLIIDAQRDEKLKEIIPGMISRLKGEERLILRMRFPVQPDEEPKEIDQIAQLLGLTKKAVYNRLSRVLKKCRDLIIGSGINYHDLF